LDVIEKINKFVNDFYLNYEKIILHNHCIAYCV